jgi:hypothetical protein
LDAKLTPRAAADFDFKPLREASEFKKLTGK